MRHLEYFLKKSIVNFFTLLTATWLLIEFLNYFIEERLKNNVGPYWKYIIGFCFSAAFFWALNQTIKESAKQKLQKNRQRLFTQKISEIRKGFISSVNAEEVRQNLYRINQVIVEDPNNSDAQFLKYQIQNSLKPLDSAPKPYPMAKGRLGCLPIIILIIFLIVFYILHVRHLFF